MKNKKTFLVLIVALFLLASCMLTGCSPSTNSPSEIIQDRYGNKEYNISFYSEAWDKPIPDITYTAKSMPTLPTPSRVGYIFQGWYYDRSFVEQYADGSLLLKMKDLTLYAKWAQEEFTQNGSYDIEFSAKIVPDSTSFGSGAEKYGYLDFTKAIVADQTYIEKTNDKLLLRIQYDCKKLQPISLADYPTFTVGISNRNTNTSLFIADKIDSYTDSVKTIFVDISSFNITDSIYLDISTTNWVTEGLTDNERISTKSTYDVDFKVTRLIGFGNAFVDTNTQLADGYYSVRSYFSKENLEETMMDLFNPVYSYLIVKDGNYTFVKPTYAYTDYTEYSMGKLLDKYTANYFYRMTSLINYWACYDIDSTGVEKSVDSDYYPSLYKAGKYHNYSMEFHADTGAGYAVIDLGNTLSSKYILTGSVTGFMEVAVGLGSINTVMTLDTKHIIKLNSIDFTPMSGDNFEFSDETYYYPGDVTDMSKSSGIEDLIEKYGLSTRHANYYYTCKDKNTDYQNRTLYSSKITYIPTEETNSVSIANAKGRPAYFRVNTKIYGYVPKKEKLFADCITVKNFDVDNALREFVEVKTGKTLKVGTTVSLSALYAEKVSSTTQFANVSWQGYKIVNGEADYSSPIKLDGSFDFSGDIAIKFTADINNSTSTTLIFLTTAKSPDIEISDTDTNWKLKNGYDNVYTSNKSYRLSDEISFPYVNYAWGNIRDNFHGNYYSTEFFVGNYGIKLQYVGLLYKQTAGTNLVYPDKEKTTFKISSNVMDVVYELVNDYGEIKNIYFEYDAENKENYTISDGKGNFYETGDVKYNKDGELENLNVTISDVMNSGNLKELLSHEFYYTFGDVSGKFKLKNYSVYSDKGSDTIIPIEGNTINITDVMGYIANTDYAVIMIKYESNGNILTAVYIYNATFDGDKNYSLFNFDDYFTNNNYYYHKNKVFSSSGITLATTSVEINKYVSLSSNELADPYSSQKAYISKLAGLQYAVVFNQTGKYRIKVSFTLQLNDGTKVSLALKQDIVVSSGLGDVTITYITDAKHKFSDDVMREAVLKDDGSYAFTVRYNLTKPIITVKDVFSNHGYDDSFFGWSNNVNSRTNTYFLGGSSIENFVKTFNKKDIEFHAVWDKGLTVTATKTNNSDQHRSFKLQSKPIYTINFSAFSAIAPSGYKFIGWTGGFLGETIISPEGEYVLDLEDAINGEKIEDFFTVSAVYRKEMIVRYSVNNNYSDSYFRNNNILDGFALPVVNIPTAKNGYKFIGWKYVTANDDKGYTLSKQFVNLSNSMNQNMTFNTFNNKPQIILVAIFEDAKGNVIW